MSGTATDSEVRTLVIQLRNMLVAAYSPHAFDEFLYGEMHEIDYHSIPNDGDPKVRVFNTLQEAMRFGEMRLVVELARRAAAKRPRHQGLGAIAARLQGCLAPPAPPGGPSPDGSHGEAPPPGPREPPPYIANSLAFFATAPSEMIGMLRPKLREVPHQDYGLPARYHLSLGSGQRLVAVLALEAEPDAAYLRWLSERMTVEPPEVGLIAAKALTTAALRADGSATREIRTALREATERLDELAIGDDPKSAGYDIAARKRQINQALSLLDLRSLAKVWELEAGEFHSFITSAAAAFDRAGIEKFCQARLQSDMRRLANPDDPPELIVTTLTLTACEMGWLPELIREAVREKPDLPGFVAIAQRHAVALGI